jgi:hypothetical protein
MTKKRRRPIWTEADRRAEATAVYDAIADVKREAAVQHLARALTFARLAGSNAAIAGMREAARSQPLKKKRIRP